MGRGRRRREKRDAETDVNVLTQLKLQNSVKMPYNKNNEIQLKCGDLSTDESVWALGFSDGTIIVYSILWQSIFASN